MAILFFIMVTLIIDSIFGKVVNFKMSKGKFHLVW